MKTASEARKALVGKTVRVFGKYVGTVKKVFSSYTDSRWCALVLAEGREMIALPAEIEIAVEEKTILGYVISSEKILAAARG